ncbi:MAG TPA: hypothetical protein DEO68_00335 [Halomonas campaniensis]|uniref:Uncharacterized protein n=2 Tax=Halomonas TaxID=2745 RepID=A0A3D0KAS2_9GAMM|nr:hypothetical protein [Halomonas campaniensis]
MLNFSEASNSMAEVRVLYRSDDYYITLHYPINSVGQTIIVAFDTIDGVYSEKGFGVNFCLANNLPVIFVSHKERTFFQGVSKKLLYNILHPYLIGKDVVTYGSILGGYAAIYYADVLNARAFAISPRCSADPKFKKKFGKNNLDENIFLHDFLSTKNNGKQKYHFFTYDPFNSRDDYYFKEVIFPSLNGSFKVLELPFSSHPSAPFLSRKVNLLKPLALSFFQGEDIGLLSFISPQASSGAKSLFYLNIDLDTVLSKARDSFADGRWEEVASLLYVPLIFHKFQSEEAAFMLAVSLLKEGHKKELILLCRVSKKFNYIEYKQATSLAERAMAGKNYIDAISLWECIIKIYSKFPLGVYVRLASAYIMTSEFKKAEQVLEQCLDINESFKPALDLLDRVASLQAKKFTVSIREIAKPSCYFRLGTKVDGTIVRQKELYNLKVMGWAQIKKGDVSAVAVQYKNKISYFSFNIERPDAVQFLVTKLGLNPKELSSRCGVKVAQELGEGAKFGFCVNGKTEWTHVLSLTPVAELVKGRDNWLFLANDQNCSVDQFTGKLLLDEDKKLAWCSYANDFYEVSKKFNALYVIANSKERVLPGLYPFSQGVEILAHQVENILSDSSVNVVNPVDENSKNIQSYYETDTHWSDVGAFNAFKLCMKAFGYNDEFDVFFEFFGREVVGDLGSKLTPPVSSIRMTHSLRDKAKGSVKCVFDNKIKKTGSLEINLNETAVYEKTVLLFGGSSLKAGGFARYFSYFFSRVVVINLPGSIVKEIVDHECPDHIIVQTNERYLISPGRVYETVVGSPLVKSFKMMSQKELLNFVESINELDDESESYYKKLFGDAALSFVVK